MKLQMNRKNGRSWRITKKQEDRWGGEELARKLRVWWSGAGYHIMSRGNHRLEIFRDDEDRQVFLSMLAQVKEKHPFKLHAYCLINGDRTLVSSDVS